MIHVVAHLFITLHYGLTLWSPKLTWSFLQSVYWFVAKAIKFIRTSQTSFSIEHVFNGPLN